MDFSCGLFPDQRSPELAVLAESLGYRRVWVYDSPALGADVWVTLARIAERTRRIGLGPGVLVPGLRHVMVTAAAIGTVESIAPGRVAIAVSTGFTGRVLLGERSMRWAAVADYVRALKGLLCGDEVEFEGHLMQMLHPDGAVARRPIPVPIVITTNGPKGLEVAREVGDGVMSGGFPCPGFDWSIVVGGGTVLEEDEDASAPRALAAAGPFVTSLYHLFYELPGLAMKVEELPGGASWRAEVDAIPKAVRHLRLHESHFLRVDERDRALVTGETVTALSWTGRASELRERFAQYEAQGATEIFFEPTGPDIAREITAFARAVGLTENRPSNPR
jgi:5,10-methylenetetrahydromethanopterin reductase